MIQNIVNIRYDVLYRWNTIIDMSENIDNKKLFEEK